MITREQAHWTASGFLRQNWPELICEITNVLTLDEITFREPCLYGVSDEDLGQSWIAYCHKPEMLPMLCSSTIIVISKDTGKVIYSGSANDEG